MPGLGTAKCLEAAGIAKDEREEEAKRGERVRGAISQTALWQDANTSFPHGPPANFPSDSARQLPALSQYRRCHLRLSARAGQHRLCELQAQTTTFATTVFRTVYELCFFSSKWSSRTRSLRRQIVWLLLR